MLGSDGDIEVFARRHLPLGVLADDELDTLAETRAFGIDAQLFLYSDGLIEAENASGEMFGFAGLVAAVTAATADARFAAAVAAVRAHMDTTASRDDISIVAVNCRREDVRADTPPPHVAADVGAADPGCWRFGLRLGAAELRQLDVVPLLLGLVNQFDGARERSGELFVIMSELFNNALDHGLLHLDSRQKLQPDGMGRYLELRQERLATLDGGHIEIEIEQFSLAGAAWLRIVCRDTGPGFDHAAVLRAPAAGDLPFGRGLALVRKLAASFELNDAGNAATAILAPSSAASAQTPPF
jgi:anti-sigma regulatory factor (Ser/Thr protein kinase)